MTSKRKFVKKAVSIGLSATLALSAVGFSALATSDESVFPVPTTAATVDSSVLTATSQRAASEIPLVFGVNVVAGTLFTGPIDMAGTDVNEAVDPYLYNYNYVESADEDDEAAYILVATNAGGYYNDGSVVASLGTLHNADGLYSSGGGNQVYFGGAGNVDVFFGFNSTVYTEIVSQGESAVVTDVQTGSATSRLYAWTEMGKALSGYLSDNASKTVRYGDPYTIAVSLEQFSAGIPYYISKLIDNGTLTKKTAAFVTQEEDGVYTCADPASMGDVRSDVFVEAGNFDFITAGTYETADLADEEVDLVILSATGYSYTGGTTGVKDSLSNKKGEIIEDLATEFGSSTPLVMSGDNYGITIGNNGYNYSPITCMFLPYIQVYAYMDQLAEASSVDASINPGAMVQFMIEEFFHVSDAYRVDDDDERDEEDYTNDDRISAQVAQYYIDTNWDTVLDSSDTNYAYDKVPASEGYTYDYSDVVSAIKEGVEYANSLSADSSHTLLAAYRTSDNAYKIVNALTTDEPDENAEEGTDYIVLTVGSTTSYLDLDTLETNYPDIVEFYGSAYRYGYTLEETLQNYASHMVDHVWVPHTDASGAYYYVATE